MLKSYVETWIKDENIGKPAMPNTLSAASRTIGSCRYSLR